MNCPLTAEKTISFERISQSGWLPWFEPPGDSHGAILTPLTLPLTPGIEAVWQDAEVLSRGFCGHTSLCDKSKGTSKDIERKKKADRASSREGLTQLCSCLRWQRFSSMIFI